MAKTLSHKAKALVERPIIANVATVDAVRANFGFEPRPMRPNLGYLKKAKGFPFSLLDQGMARMHQSAPR